MFVIIFTSIILRSNTYILPYHTYQISFVFYRFDIAAQTDEDEDGRDEMFEDEGPSRVIARGREFQRRAWSEGRWARLPRRLNLRALADLRAVRLAPNSY